MNQVTNKSNRAVESVTISSRQQRSQDRALAVVTDNVLSTFQAGPIIFNTLKKSSMSLPSKGLDTSRRYFHVGGAMHLYRTNRVWESSRAQVKYNKGKFGIGSTPRYNQQAPGTPGVRLPSLPLPPFRANDVKKRAIVTEMPKQDEFECQGMTVSGGQHLVFLKDEHFDVGVRNFVYDAFLDDDQNRELASAFRKHLVHSEINEVKQRSGVVHNIAMPNDGFISQSGNWEIIYDNPVYQQELEEADKTSEDPIRKLLIMQSEVDRMLDETRVMREQLAALREKVSATFGRVDLFGDEKVIVELENDTVIPKLEREDPREVVQETERPAADRDFAQFVSQAGSSIESDYEDVEDAEIMAASNGGPNFVDDYLERQSIHVLPGMEYVKSAYQKVLDVQSSVLNTYTATTNTLQSLPSLAVKTDTVLDSMNTVAAQASDLLGRIQAMVSSLPDTLHAVGDLAGALFNLTYDLTHASSYSLLSLIIKLGVSLRTIFKAFFPSVRQVEQNLPLISQAKPTSLSTIMSLLTGSPEFIKLAQTANAFHQFRQGFKTAQELASYLFGFLPDFIKEIIDRLYPSQSATERRFQALVTLVEKCKWLITTNTIIPLDTVNQIIAEISYFQPMLSVPTKETYGTCQIYREIIRSAHTIHEFAYNKIKFSTPRTTPFSLLLHGATRAGKSVAMPDIANILSQLDAHEGVTSYTRQAGDPHWNGYQEDTYATMYDDFLQDVSYDDVAELFALTTKQHYVVPMASLDDPTVGKKGTLNLSRVVIAATNVMNAQSVSTRINSPEALWSRFVVRAEVTKVGDYDTTGQFQHLSFRIYKKGSFTEWTSKRLTYDEFLAFIVAAKRDHFRNEDTIEVKHPRGDLLARLAEIQAQPSQVNRLASQGLWDYLTAVDSPLASNKYVFYCRLAAGFAGALFIGFSLVFYIHYSRTITAGDTILQYNYHVAMITILDNLQAHWVDSFIETMDVHMKTRILQDIRGKTARDLDVIHETSLRALLAVPSTDEHYQAIKEFLDARLKILQYTTESRTDRDPTRKTARIVSETARGGRPIATESKTERDPTKRRTNITSEHTPLEQHPKIADSPFYGQQKMIDQLYAGIDTSGVTRDQAVELYNYMVKGGAESQGGLPAAVLSDSDLLLQRVLPVSLMTRDTTNYFVGMNTRASYINAIPVSPFHILCPKHLLLGADGKFVRSGDKITYELVITHREKHHTLALDYSRVSVVRSMNGAELDAIIINLNKTTIPQLKSCIDMFVREKDLAYIVDSAHATMVGKTLIGGQPTNFMRNFTIMTLQKSVMYTHMGGASLAIHSGIAYATTTSSGDCGSPVLLHSPHVVGRVIGIHVFGHATNPWGGALTLTHEVINANLTERTAIPQHHMEHTVQFSATTDMVSKNFTIEVVGEVNTPVNSPRNTAFIPTPFHSLFAGDSRIGEPSEKFDSHGNDPLMVGNFCFGSDLFTDTDELKEPCMLYLLSKYQRRKAKVLSLEEALNKYGAMDSLNLHTSAGYPYVLRGQTKRTFFSVDEHSGYVSFNDSNVADHVRGYIDSWKTTSHEVVWITSLKDSLEKPGKLARVFEIPPFEYTIAGRAYFGAWTDMMHDTVGKHFCCVGMDPESLQWTELIYQKLKMSAYGIDADAPLWDKNLLPYVMHWACDSINRWYRMNDPSWCEDHDHARSRIVDAAIHAYMICGPLLTRKHKGMPSGLFLTALLNSVSNMVQHLIWFLKAAPPHLADVSRYDSCVHTSVYGDDSMDAVVEQLLPCLNRHSMFSIWKRHCRMIITTSAKDGKLAPHDLLLDLNFLKRDTRRDGLVFKPLLAKRSIFQMLCYVRKSKHVSAEDQLKQNVKTAAGYIYFYGPEQYNRFTAFIRSTIPGFLLPSYSYYDQMFLHGKLSSIIMSTNLNEQLDAVTSVTAQSQQPISQSLITMTTTKNTTTNAVTSVSQPIPIPTTTAEGYPKRPTLGVTIGEPIQLIATRGRMNNAQLREALSKGTQFVSQSLAPTSMDSTLTNSEENTVVNTGPTSQEASNNEIQAAPALGEKVVAQTRYDELYSVAMQCGSFVYPSTASSGTVLFQLPVSTIMGKSSTQRLFRDRRYARFDIEVTVNVTGIKFANGVMAAAVLPNRSAIPGSVGAQDATLLTYPSAGMLQRVLASNHILMDITIDGVYKFTIPYTHYNSWLSSFDYTNANYGQLVVVAQTPYNPPQGQTTGINCEVQASLVNIEHHETAPLVSQALFQFGGKSERTQNTITTMDNIKDSNMPLNVRGDALDSKVDVPVGLDNPSDPTNKSGQQSYLRLAYQKLQSWRNVLDVTKWTSTPKDMSIWSEPLCQEMRVQTDELSIEFARERWFPVATSGPFPLTTSTAKNTLLFQSALTPAHMGTTTGLNANATWIYFLTTLFNYWHGMLKFRFVMASNSYTRGKLLIAINYGNSSLLTDIGTGNLDPYSLPHLIVDLSNADKIINVDVPFKSISEFLRCPTPGAANFQTVDDEYCMGRIGVWLVSPLSVTPGSATTVNVFPQMALGPDFNFYQEAPVSRSGICSESRLVPNDTWKTNILRSSLMTPFINLKQMLSRPIPIGTFQLQTDVNGYPVPFAMPIHPVVLSNSALWSAITYGFAGIRGGYRIVIRCSNITASNSFRVQYYPYITPRTSTGGLFPPAVAGVAKWSFSETSANYSHDSITNHYNSVNVPQATAFPGLPQTVTQTALIATDPGCVRTAGNPAIYDAIIDPYSQPETVIEIPDPSPMHRTQQTTPVPVNYVVGDTGKWIPTSDRNIGWLVINAMDQASISTGVEFNVSLAAADDFRAFWFNGGPTVVRPFVSNYTPQSGSVTVQNIYAS